MAMMLPGWLGEALNYLGFNWPISNEDVFKQWASDLRGLGSDASNLQDQINSAIKHVQSHNEGEALDAFVSKVRGGDSNFDSLEDFDQACQLAADVCDTCSGIIIALKGVFIVQLGIMAASLASGPGALIVREACRRLINAGIDLAAEQVMNEIF
uniref:WXG100-like domain-containing protein n=1 Tax=Tessaracoccus timonensis TaxID=2161816 RepID=UPI000D54F9AF|nr:hypothetical protein [Tessaracoccus timonensis]